MAVLSLKDFPDDVYKALRMLAVEEDKTLRDLVIEILSKSVKKEG